MSKKRGVVRLSKDSMHLIKEALQKKKWGWSVNTHDEPLVIASTYLDPYKQWPMVDNIYAEGINESSWRRFLKGEKISFRIFIAYCYALEVVWEHVIDLDTLDDKLPFNLPSLVQREDKNEERDVSRFLRDVTVPDGSIVKANDSFLKSWEIQNAGNIPWKNRYLTRIGKEKGFGLIISPKRVKIVDTLPDEKVLIEVELIAPEAGGTYQALFKMTFADGTFCFPNKYSYGLFVTINIIQHNC
jgi:hypothetical protein